MSKFAIGIILGAVTFALFFPLGVYGDIDIASLVFFLPAAIVLATFFACVTRRFLPSLFAADVTFALLLSAFAAYLWWGGKLPWLIGDGDEGLYVLFFVLPSFTVTILAAPILWYVWKKKYGILAFSLAVIYLVLLPTIAVLGPVTKDAYLKKSLGTLEPAYMPSHYERFSEDFSNGKYTLTFRSTYESKKKAGLSASSDLINGGCCADLIYIFQVKTGPKHIPFPGRLNTDLVVHREKIILDDSRKAQYMVYKVVNDTVLSYLAWEQDGLEIVIRCSDGYPIEDACPREEMVKIAQSIH